MDEEEWAAASGAPSGLAGGGAFDDDDDMVQISGDKAGFQAWTDALTSRTPASGDNACVGRWVEAEGAVELLQQRGKKYASAGYSTGSVRMLYPEEALYLLDDGGLLLAKPPTKRTFETAFSTASTTLSGVATEGDKAVNAAAASQSVPAVAPCVPSVRSDGAESSASGGLGSEPAAEADAMRDNGECLPAKQLRRPSADVPSPSGERRTSAAVADEDAELPERHASLLVAARDPSIDGQLHTTRTSDTLPTSTAGRDDDLTVESCTQPTHSAFTLSCAPDRIADVGTNAAPPIARVSPAGGVLPNSGTSAASTQRVDGCNGTVEPSAPECGAAKGTSSATMDHLPSTSTPETLPVITTSAAAEVHNSSDLVAAHVLAAAPLDSSAPPQGTALPSEAAATLPQQPVAVQPKPKRSKPLIIAHATYPFEEAYEILLSRCSLTRYLVYSQLRSASLLVVRHTPAPPPPGGFPPLGSVSRRLVPAFDVYARDGFNTYKQSAPGPPDFYVIIALSHERMPSTQEMHDLQTRLAAHSEALSAKQRSKILSKAKVKDPRKSEASKPGSDDVTAIAATPPGPVPHVKCAIVSGSIVTFFGLAVSSSSVPLPPKVSHSRRGGRR